MNKLTHIDAHGTAQMVDVCDKPETLREARVEARVQMSEHTLALIESDGHSKGDVIAVARIAGIRAAKRCADLIPLCHPLMLTSVEVSFSLEPDANRVQIEATCKVSGKTGVEMEALTAVSVAALTIYDMCKAVDRGMAIQDIALLHKEGGKSGSWHRDQSDASDA